MSQRAGSDCDNLLPLLRQKVASLEAELKTLKATAVKPQQSAYPASELEWACAMAAANQSVTNCHSCERFMALPEVAPATAPPSWAAVTAKHANKLPSIAWFTCVTRPAAEPPSVAGAPSL